MHLLTHTHSDHITGLSAHSFGYKVVCSSDAKEMLLRHEVYAERALLEQELRPEPTRTFSHLKIDPIHFSDGTVRYVGSRDLLETIPLHKPTQYELSDAEFVTITAFDANHCPGAVMFLIEGSQGAVLHTGDFRAEPWFLESLTRNPFLQRYLAPRSGQSKPGCNETLEAIYLDTANVLSAIPLPTKERATSGLVELMKLFSHTCYFFINSWTWGYEDILKVIAREFCSKIHVDRYKYSVYHHISDPCLHSIITREASSTRFHACERFHRCDFVAVDDDPGSSSISQSYYNPMSRTGTRVVNVNPVSMGVQSWELYIQETRARLQKGERVDNLLVPLSRHSSLPELREFVALFKPKTVVPNTLDPKLKGLHWAAINKMFADCLCVAPVSAIRASDDIAAAQSCEVDVEGFNAGEDVAVQNLVGCGARDLVARWAENGDPLKKLGVLRVYLNPEETALLDKYFGPPAADVTSDILPPSCYHNQLRGVASASVTHHPNGKEHAYATDSEDESVDDDDAKGRTAHLLFAEGGPQEWWEQLSADTQEQSGKTAGENVNINSLLTPVASPLLLGRSRPVSSAMSNRTPKLSPGKRKRCSFEHLKAHSRPFPSGLNTTVLGSPFKLTQTTPARNPQGKLQGEKHKCNMVSISSLPPWGGTASQFRGNQGGIDKLELNCTGRSLSPLCSPLSKTRLEELVGPGHKERKDPFCPTNPLSELQVNHSRTSGIGESHSQIESSFRLHRGVVGLSTGEIREGGNEDAFTGSLYCSGLGVGHQYVEQNSISSAKVLNPSVPLDAPLASNLQVSSQEVRQTALPIDVQLLVVANTEPQKDASGSKSKSKRVRKMKRGEEDMLVKRLRISGRLARARPDMVVPTYGKTRARLLQRLAEVGGKELVPDTEEKSGIPQERSSSLLSFYTVDDGDGDGGMDWQRTRKLAEAVREDVQNGRRVILPMLMCTDSQ